MAATVAVATGAAVVIWTAANAAGVDLVVEAGGGGADREVGPASVLVTSLVAGLAGMALLAVLRRWTARARTVWTVLATVVLVISLLGPLGAVAASAGVVLLLMHVAVGAVILVGGRRAARTEAS